MGSRIGSRLLSSGHTLTVWNRTPARAESLVELGARAAATLPEAVANAEAIFAVLADGPAVESVVFHQGAAEALKKGSLFIDMSSIPPATAREHALKLGDLGVAYLDAPVSGGTKGAREGTLAIMVGGEQLDFERASGLLKLLGHPTYVGPAGSGQLAKLANQVICGVTIGAVAEGLVLVATGGADPQLVREALFGGFADSRVLREHGGRMIERNFEPGGPTRMHLKDLETALDVARELELDLQLAEATRSLFAAFSEHGGAGLDHSGVILELERRNPVTDRSE
jgi:2-hydroxy-3-oxopropionate reductase